MRSASAVAGVVVAAALCAPAFADPSISGVEVTKDARGRLTVAVDASVAKPGRLRVAGTVNGRRLNATKRLSSGDRTVRLRFDARRAGIRRTGDALLFDLTATATERGASTTATAPIQAVVPVPLIVLGGLGNESVEGAGAAFAAAIDLAADGAYGVGTASPSLRIHTYESLTVPLERLGDDFEAVVRRTLRGTPFTKVDLAGFSMGGLVAREWASERGDRRVRRLILLATPNEGAPIAYVAFQLADPESPFAGLLEDLPADLSGLADAFFPGGGTDVLRTFFPSYEWAFTRVFGNPVPIPSQFLPDSASPLTALNDVAPPAGAEVHAVYYSDILPELLPAELVPFALGTIDEVDFTSILLGGTPDLATIASGDGDGVVPVRSARMEGVPSWRAVMTDHDLGAGFHTAMPIDPRVAQAIVEITLGTR